MHQLLDVSGLISSPQGKGLQDTEALCAVLERGQLTDWCSSLSKVLGTGMKPVFHVLPQYLGCALIQKPPRELLSKALAAAAQEQLLLWGGDAVWEVLATSERITQGIRDCGCCTTARQLMVKSLLEISLEYQFCYIHAIFLAQQYYGTVEAKFKSFQFCCCLPKLCQAKTGDLNS